MSDVTLVGIVHDPDGRYLHLINDDLPPLMEQYATISAICGAGTAPETVEALRERGIAVITGADIPINARPYALRFIAAHPAWQHIHLTDLDHTLHWARAWPEELAAVDEQIAD